MRFAEMKKLADILHWQFRESVSGLPSGFVSASASQGELRLTIGPRTLVINGRLEVVNAETSVADRCLQDQDQQS